MAAPGTRVCPPPDPRCTFERFDDDHLLRLAGMWAMRRLEATFLVETEGVPAEQQALHCGRWLRACAAELLARSKARQLRRLHAERADGRRVAHRVAVLERDLAILRSWREKA